MGLKPGLWSCSQMPRNSTVLRLRSQLRMRSSVALGFRIPVTGDVGEADVVIFPLQVTMVSGWRMGVADFACSLKTLVTTGCL